MSLVEAMKMALEALELGYDYAKSEADRYHEAMAGYKPERHAQVDAEVQQIAKAITALRQELAMSKPSTKIFGPSLEEILNSAGFYRKREWVGLTDDEIDTWNIVGHESLREFVRAIEAKLKEKNA